MTLEGSLINPCSINSSFVATGISSNVAVAFLSTKALSVKIFSNNSLVYFGNLSKSFLSSS